MLNWYWIVIFNTILPTNVVHFMRYPACFPRKIAPLLSDTNVHFLLWKTYFRVVIRDSWKVEALFQSRSEYIGCVEVQWQHLLQFMSSNRKLNAPKDNGSAKRGKSQWIRRIMVRRTRIVGLGEIYKGHYLLLTRDRSQQFCAINQIPKTI